MTETKRTLAEVISLFSPAEIAQIQMAISALILGVAIGHQQNQKEG